MEKRRVECHPVEFQSGGSLRLSSTGFCAVSMVCVTLGSVTLCGVETYKLTRHSNLYKWSKGHVVSAG